MNDLLVSEIYGPTVQGEGPSVGRHSSFVRLGLCNLDCAWCDSAFTWDWTGKNGPPQDKSALIHMSASEVVTRVRQIGARLVVFTGGEPMIQQRQISKVMDGLDGFTFEIETNGTIEPSETMGFLSRMRLGFNVSPKLPSSGVDSEHADRAMKIFGPRVGASFKFVISDDVDLAALDDLVGSHEVRPSRIWVMPEGRTHDEVMARSGWLVKAALVRGYNFSTRLHVLLWGDERGR